MKWWSRLRERAVHLLPPDTDTDDSETARAMRETAEEALRAEREREREVRAVAATSRKLRTQNNFSARITESFQGKA